MKLNNRHLLVLMLLLSIRVLQAKDKDNGSKIVIEIGNVSLTSHELNKQLTPYLADYQKRYGTPPPTDSIKKEINKFIDYSYFLAAAYAKGYQQNPEVNDKVLSASKYMISQKNSILYKKVIAEKVVMTDAEVRDAVKKSEKKLSLSLLVFKNKQEMVSTLGSDTILTSISAFFIATEKCKKMNGVKPKELTTSIPSVQLGVLNDIVWGMPTGSVSKPIYSFNGPYNNAIYIICKLHVEENTHKDSTGIKSKLQAIAEEKLYFGYTHEILKSSGIAIDQDVLQSFAAKIKYGNNTLLLKQSVTNLLDKNLLWYQVKNEKVKLTVSDFIEYFNTKLLVRQRLNTANDFDSFLKNIVISEMSYNQAFDIGLTAEPEFALNQLNFKNRTIVDVFKTNELLKTISITEVELKNEYERQKQYLSTPDSIEISVFKFNDLKGAQQSLAGLRNINGENDKQLNILRKETGLKSFSMNINLQSNAAGYNPQLINYLFAMPVGSTSKPLTINNEITVVKKEKNIGLSTKTFEEVKPHIKNKLTREKEAIAIKEFLELAKRNYTLKNNININDYTLVADAK